MSENRLQVGIAALATAAIVFHLMLRGVFHVTPAEANLPLIFVLLVGGLPLIYVILRKLVKGNWSSDLLAGIAIVTSAWLREYLAGTVVVLMLAGGTALEAYAVGHASAVLRALAQRMPSMAHRKRQGQVEDIGVSEVVVGDKLVLFPHEIAPVDGRVTEGQGSMDESYLTGEPFQMSKAPGAEVLSGAINGNSVLTITAVRPAIDSRYAKIMEVMRGAEQKRPHLRRLGDQLGAIYTPISLAIALVAWAVSQDPQRFLAVLVVATPCPLIIAIPIAIIGAISLSARRSIVIKNPLVLERINTCRTAIFDKTGTLTYGKAKLTDIVSAEGFTREKILGWVASLERYSKHPLAPPVLAAAESAGMALQPVTRVREDPGQGLTGTVEGHEIRITSRRHLLRDRIVKGLSQLTTETGGLECQIVVDQVFAATLRFRDEIRPEGVSFVGHLGPKHHFDREMIVSGDRASEVKYLADQVGIENIYAEKSPEEKLAIVRQETARAKTLYMGDGINDAPALLAATVGVVMGHHSDVTAEAGGAVIMDSSLQKVDELLHISRRMRTIALQSAIGGMALSAIGMLFASGGLLSPVAGAITQEMIDVAAILNALRAAIPPKALSDF